MIKQTLLFSSPVFLSLKDHQIVITFKDNKDTVTRPIEDIGFVVIENPQVSISIPLLNELADNNVSVVFCDKKQMPKTMLMTLEGNTTQQESYKYQIDASAPMKKNIWKQLVECKIKNQALLLKKVGKNGDALKQYYMNVKSGDSDNREGAAAREYWGHIFDEGFKRVPQQPIELWIHNIACSSGSCINWFWLISCLWSLSSKSVQCFSFSR